MKRFIALVICFMMVLGNIPQISVFAAEGDFGKVLEVNPGEEAKIADPDTLHGWKSYFGEEYPSTEYSGRIWADKSVFETASDFKAAQSARESIEGNEEYNALSIDEENFLVALSGIAANKEIAGYSALPTDTVFILDVSGSMDDGGYIPNMVDAANNAIEELMKLNFHNRISVVLYSGNAVLGSSNLSHASVLLPLNRYSAGKNGEYLTWSGKSGNTTVSVAENVKNEAGESVSGAKKTDGGTYIQGGLYLAYKEFEKAYDNGTTAIESDFIQGGTKRIPIITLMSDGLPTAATDEYSSFKRSNGTGLTNFGNGGENSSTITFLTQLTAKWVKESVSIWYENEALFYTLWLKDEGDNSANETLDPQNSGDTIDSWWKTFLEAEKGSEVRFSEGNRGFGVVRDDIIERISPESENYTVQWQKAQNYVDEAFTASNAGDFEEAFADIVGNIVSRSEYYPTLVEGGSHDSAGYITIEDPLGEFMEVKEIKGIDIGGHLFTGSALIRMMADNEFGSKDSYSEKGWLLIEAIMERIGVSESVAIALAHDAWKYGQLGYDHSTGKYSNFIGWYADENNNYLGFWHEGYTEKDIPANAAQYIKSYGFYGVIDEAISDSNIEGEDMMHIAVRVATDLDDKDQTVTFGIPAALIPLVHYNVEVNGSSLDNAKEVTLDIEGAEHPVRLLFEVGLREGINELTVDEITRANNHYHTDSERNYIFFTNRWGQDPNAGGVIEYPDPTSSTATVSHYIPSVQNERYYYTEDAAIFKDTNGNEYTGTEAPYGNGYYRCVYVFERTGSGNKAEIIKKYLEITPEALAHAEKDAEGLGWHIPQGTMRYDIAGEGAAKTANRTGTLAYSMHSDIPGYSEGKCEVYKLHGNNGVMFLKPATGIKITKDIPVVIPGTDTEDFILGVKFTPEEGRTLPETVKVSYDGKTYTEMDVNSVFVTLDEGQSVYIYGLPKNTEYIITEEPHEDYFPVNTEITGTVKDGRIIPVVFENRAKQPGSIVIHKEVEHPFGENADGLDEITFNFVAQILDENGNPAANYSVKSSVGDVTTDGEGNISFGLGAGESFSFSEIKEGYKLRVFEVDIPEGFMPDEEVKEAFASDEEAKEITFTNRYEPKSVPKEDINITIEGGKNLIGRSWLADDVFSFELMYWNGSEWEEVTGNCDNTVTGKGDTFSLTDAINDFEFSREGAFDFWVAETSGNIGGVKYDSTHRYFTVNVSDNWSGHYEIEGITEVDSRIDFTETSENGKKAYSLNMDFTNSYVPAGSDGVEITIKKNIKGAVAEEISLAGFSFAVFDGDKMVSHVVSTDESGNAAIELVFDSSYLTPVYENGVIARYDDTVFNYTIREIEPEEEQKVPGITYTKDFAYLVITISDNLDGTISAKAVITPGEGAKDVEVMDGTAVFTNTFEKQEEPKPPVIPEEPNAPITQLTVIKKWDDNNNKEGKRPAGVEIQIYANGRRYGGSFLLNEANGWSYTAKNLPMYDIEGKRIEYTAAEINIPKNYYPVYDYRTHETVIISNVFGAEEQNPETGAPIY